MGIAEDLLAHHGIKGMKWGVRRDMPSGPTAVGVEQRGKRLKTSGGENQPAHPDAVAAAAARQKAKKSGVASLSNQELQAFTARANLERQFRSLKNDSDSEAKKFVRDLLVNEGKNQLRNIISQQATQQINELLKKTQK